MLSCFDTATGDLIWRNDTTADYGVTVPVFGVSQSPLVEGEHLIVLLGGEPDAKVVAFDKATGAEAWRALDSDSEPGYSSPIVITAGGVRQLIVWHASAVTSLDPATGEIYWNQPFEVGGGLSIATPVRSGRYLAVSQFFNGTMMFALNPDRPAARMLWQGRSRTEFPDETDTLHAIISTPIVVGDHLYGVGSYGELRGLDATSGERLWQSDRMNAQDRWATAYFVRNGDRHFVVNDSGDLIIARFSPEGIRRGRPDAAADPDHAHAWRRHRPLERPGRAVGPSGVRQRPRHRPQRRRGRAAVARGGRLRAGAVTEGRRRGARSARGGPGGSECRSRTGAGLGTGSPWWLSARRPRPA